MAENPYMRKKQPEQVRRALLDAASEIVTTKGITALTIAAVAEAAGVTKGGLFHHFANKQALLAALHRDLFDKLDVEIDAIMAVDAEPEGRFTRAYVQAFLSGDDFRENSPWIALSGAFVGEVLPDLNWGTWIDGRMARHGDTDDRPDLEVVRYAADGAWFTFIARPPTPERLAALRDRLIAMTRTPSDGSGNATARKT